MAFERILRPEKRPAPSTRIASGTLACPRCDAPVLPGPLPLAPADDIGCPFCRHVAAVRDFLSLATPGRPARVEVRVRVGGGRALRRPPSRG